MTLNELIFLDACGYIPGPSETEEEFMRRVISWSQAICQEEGQKPIPEKDRILAHERTERLYGFRLTHILAVYGNENLSPWQGGMLWSYETQNGDSFPFIQLKERFKNGSYLGYAREEVLSHELVHAARFAFNESCFEEFFAYQTSINKLRKALGPLFQTPKESWILILGLLLGWAAFFMTDYFPPLSVGFYIPFVILGCFLLRLGINHLAFIVCSWKVKNMICPAKGVLAFMLRLTDREIFKFAFSSQKTILSYLSTGRSLRIKVICSYLSNAEVRI